MVKLMICWCLIALILMCVGFGSIWGYLFWVEHVTYEKQDSKTGLKFIATCQYSEYSYRTYVIVKSPSGRLISKNEIPFSADEISDCKRQPYYMVVDFVPDSSYEKLSVQFADEKRPPVEVPLLLDGIDLPNLPKPSVNRTTQ